MPARTGPLRTLPIAGVASPSVTAAPSDHRGDAPAAAAIGAAYRVFDAYVEEGRRYAAGHSAWFDATSRDPAAARDAGRSPPLDARALVELWGVLSGVLEAVRRGDVRTPADQLARATDLVARIADLADPGRAAAPAPGAPPTDADPPRWRRWFDPDPQPREPVARDATPPVHAASTIAREDLVPRSGSAPSGK